MGVDYVWVCDERREWIDPYPLDAPHLFEWCRSGVTYGARGEVTEGWYGLPVRLLSDCGGSNDEYYLRTCRADDDPSIWGGGAVDVYREVTADALHAARAVFADRWWERRP